MADQLLYRLGADTSDLDRAAATSTRAVDALDAAVGRLSAQLGTAGSAGTALAQSQGAAQSVLAQVSRAAEEQTRALQRLQSAASGQALVLGAPDGGAALKGLANIRQAAQAAERADYVAQQQALAGIVRDGEAGRVAREKAAQDLITAARQSAQAKERADYQAQQQFLAGLAGTANAAGKTRAELLAIQAAELKVTKEAAPLIERIAASDRGFQSFNKTGRLTALELQQVGFQLNDFFVQVASGGRPLTALIQQGSQLSGTFGGIGNAARAVASLVTPAGLVIGGIAAAIGAVAIAAIKGQEESAALANAIRITGNYAGVTAGQVDAMAHSIASLQSRPVADVREALQALIATGAVGPQALQPVAEAVAAFSRASGQSAEEVVKDFAQMQGGVAKWATEHARRYHDITAATIAHVRQLESEGRTQEAAAIAAQAITQRHKDEVRQLGLLDAALEGSKRLWKDFWDAAFDIGREKTVEQKLAEVEARLKGASFLPGRSDGRSFTPGSSTGYVTQAAQRNADLDERNALLRERGVQVAAAARRAQQAADEQKKIEEQSSQRQAALASRDKAGADLRLAQAEAFYADQKRALDRSFDQQLVSQQQFAQKSYDIDQALLAARLKALDAESAAEARQPVGTPDEKLQREARLVQLRARRLQIEEQLRANADKLRDGGYAGKPREVIEDPQSAFRQSELAQTQAVEQGLAERRVAAFAADHDLLDANRQLSIDLITDDRARGAAQIALEAEQLRKRLDLASLSAEDRKRVEGDLATYVAQREAQLTEQLKPEYQRQLELYRDTTRFMRQASDDFHAGFLQTAEDAFVEFEKTGRLSFKSLADYALEQFSRIAFRRFFAEPIDKAAGALFDFIKPAFGAASNTPQETFRQAEIAAQNAAQQATLAAQYTITVGQLQVLNTTALPPATSALIALAGAANAATAALAASGSVGFSTGSLSSLFGGSGSFIGGTSYGGGDFTADPFQAIGLHGGGVVGRDTPAFTRMVPASLFADAPRYHNGFLAAGEKAAILRDDETVLTPEQMRQYAPVRMPVQPQIQAPQPIKVVIENHVGADIQATPETGPDGTQQLRVIVKAAADLAHQRVTADLASGTGPASTALRARGVDLGNGRLRRT